MDMSVEERMREFPKFLEELNREKRSMCEVCSKGKLYRPGEPVPFITYDVKSITPIEDIALKANGRCNDCGHQVEFIFYLVGR